MRQIPILTAVLTVLASPLAAQETVGTMTLTIGAEERTFVVVQGPDQPTSGFRRDEGEIVVTLVARPDRVAGEGGEMMELDFAVTGMGPTAAPHDATLSHTRAAGQTLSTGEGSVDISMTSFGIQNEVLTVSGNVSSQLQANEGGPAETALTGDFQATLREEDDP